MQPTSVFTLPVHLEPRAPFTAEDYYAISHDELRITCKSAPPHECFFLLQDWAGPITGFQTLREVIKDIYLLNTSC